ncbi:MAG: hypothetical protein ABL986_09790 [Vicinamibacterales bacterium]
MISDMIVWASVVFTLAFLVAWGLSPALRRWIERPKHRFLDDVRAYDHAPASASLREGDRS